MPLSSQSVPAGASLDHRAETSRVKWAAQPQLVDGRVGKAPKAGVRTPKMGAQDPKDTKERECGDSGRNGEKPIANTR